MTKYYAHIKKNLDILWNNETICMVVDYEKKGERGVRVLYMVKLGMQEWYMKMDQQELGY